MSLRLACPKRRPRLSALALASVLAAALTAPVGESAADGLQTIDAPTGSASVRYASPASTDTTGPCTAEAPCRIDHALHEATSGDEVVLAPGEYRYDYSAHADVPVKVHGVDGKPRPRLIGSGGYPTLSLAAGGSVRHVEVVSTTGQPALSYEGGVASDVIVSGVSLGIRISPGATGKVVLRDSVAHATGANGRAIKVLDSSQSAHAVLLNVTAISTGATSTGILSFNDEGKTYVRNSIVRGTSHDFDVNEADSMIFADHSNYRDDKSTGTTDRGENQNADPSFADSANGDYRPVAGSPTIDRGTADESLGATDPDGNARTLGVAVDIGAFEFVPPAAPPAPGAAPAPLPGTTPPPSTPPPAPLVPADPQVARSVVVAPLTGTVAFRAPGAQHYVSLGSGRNIPMGSVVDASHGTVSLTSARNTLGTSQTAHFSGGVFEIRQHRSAAPVTDLYLRGGSLGPCRTSEVKANASSARRRSVRRLWGSGHGRFRTHGVNSVASVLGTIWLTQDTCAGTRTVVKRGLVAVRDLRRHRTVKVPAGHSYLARRR